jgi:hypothetical protein
MGRTSRSTSRANVRASRYSCRCAELSVKSSAIDASPLKYAAQSLGKVYERVKRSRDIPGPGSDMCQVKGFKAMFY